jgi:molybdate-binding protein/DNA-binding XRE family transcriptional regulator
MATSPPNRVRALRESALLSQQALADAVQITRQSVHLIETGRSAPSVDIALRLAHALDTTVENLFGSSPNQQVLWSEAESPAATGRVALAHLQGRWVSYPLERDVSGRSADALVTRSKGRKVEVELLRAASSLADQVVLMGCAPALGLLADRLNHRSGTGRFLWFPRASTQALQALARGQTHMAGVHLTDAKTGVDNVPDVRRHTRQQEVAMISLARWEAGIVIAAGNPKGIHHAADLQRRGVRLAIREPGSGARRLLDRELARSGGSVRLLFDDPLEVRGHMEVAAAVCMGAADAGIATKDAALSFGLPFLPLAEERYDLVIPSELQREPRMQRLLDLMTTLTFRKELSAIGYDVRCCGEQITKEASA